MHSIRFKILALTIAAILTCIVVLGGFGILTIGVQSDRSSAEKMQMISQITQQQLDAYLNSLQQSVDMAIHTAGDSLDGLDPALLRDTDRTPEQARQLDAAMTAHCARVEHAFSSIASNTSGIVTYYYCINSDLGSSEHGFFLSSLGTDEFVRQPPLLSYELDPDDIEHTTWYYSPIEAGHPIWIGPYLAHFLGERWTVSYVAPIYSGDVLLGVLGMDILFDTMTELVGSLQIYDTGFVTLLDADGRVLYHPDLGIGETLTPAGEQFEPGFFAAETSGGELIRYKYGNEERQMAYSTLSNGMKVVVSAPVREIAASQRQLTALILLATVVLLAVFVAITVVSVDSVTGPLLKLAAASKELVAGNYDVELDYEGRDEAGDLTDSFRKMRDHIKLYISDLNSRAYTDALTGVKNKGALDISAARLNDTISRGARYDMPEFALVIFDCNRLKQINDTFGHDCGDTYLKTACDAICGVFSHSSVFRTGGDEFVVLLQHQDYEEREQLLRIFDERVEQINAAETDPWRKVSLSRGMSEFYPESDKDVWVVLRRADQTMYEDKRCYKQTQEIGQ